VRAALALAVFLPLLAAGCGQDGGGAPSGSTEHQVMGVLTRVDNPPEDLPVTITIATERRLETVRLPDKPIGQPPSDDYVALYQKAIAIETGKTIVVSGDRDDSGVLVVDKIEVLP
jgi:hypothetical protein